MTGKNLNEDIPHSKLKATHTFWKQISDLQLKSGQLTKLMILLPQPKRLNMI